VPSDTHHPHPSQSSDIAVIVINYGTAHLAIAAVNSVLAHSMSRRDIEVHLVDNASPGGADARSFAQAARHPDWRARVTLYAETENHGFGRGNNLVLRKLAARPHPPRFVFLLNPDAMLENDAIGHLVSCLEQNPSAGFAGAGISRPGAGPVTAAFRFPKPAGELPRTLAFGPVSRALAHLQTPLPPDHPDGPVDWVAGAAVLARFDALADLGFFDPGYFLYFEEVDLMLRGARRGWDCVYVPQARVTHAEGAATNVSSHASGRPRRPTYWYQSWRKYYTDNYGKKGVWIAALSSYTGALGNCVLSLVPGRRVTVPGHFLGDFWRMVWRPLLGLGEKPHG